MFKLIFTLWPLMSSNYIRVAPNQAVLGTTNLDHNSIAWQSVL